MTPSRRPQIRVAVVGGGVAGLAAAHTLQGLAEVSLFEARERFGGDAHTLDTALPGADGQPQAFSVDTGVLVFNERHSPNLLALLARLDLAPTVVDASFTVRGSGRADGALDWGGPDLARALAPSRRLLNPRFWRLLAELPRWQRLCAALAPAADAPEGALLAPLADVLRVRHFSDGFRDGYLLPLCSGFSGHTPEALLQAPAAGLLRWCQHHGLPALGGASPWRGVAGGTRQIVRALLAELADARLFTPVRQVLRDGQGLRLVTDRQVERFDAVVLACHADQALHLLGATASEQEQAVLGAFRFEPGRVLLHTDTSVLPAARGDWAAWNVQRGSGAAPASLHVLLNRVQPLPLERPVLLSRNPPGPIAAERVLGQWTLEQPVFDSAALHAQLRLPAIQGLQHTWYAGAWCGSGLMEDGLKAGLHAARALIDRFALVPRLSERGALRQALPGVLA